MVSKSPAQPRPESPAAARWVRIVAWLLCITTFPLLWIGGLVTTTKSGMAVPDWPGTYGYNMFLYPMSTWWSGPWDLFVEHGHRLLATVVGLLSIILAVLLWKNDSRPWIKTVGIVAVVGVVAQGVLGGLRVVLDDRILAMVHGCVGPLFFALTVAIVAWTSRMWDTLKLKNTPPQVQRLLAVGRVAVPLVYIQMVVGALLRHMPVTFSTATFSYATYTHIILAGIVTVLVLRMTWLATRKGLPTNLRRWGALLAIVMVVQLGLGLATWLMKFSIPLWLRSVVPMSPEAILADGWWQSHTVTLHQAIGAMLLGTTTMVALIAWRLVPRTAGQTATDSISWANSRLEQGASPS